MRSLPALLVITVLLSTTQYLDPLQQLSARRRHGEAQSVELPLSLAVELSPAPLRWKTLNPEVQLYVWGSEHSRWKVSSEYTSASHSVRPHDILFDSRYRMVGAVFFDFQKAFDTVPHQPLVDKLCQLGLNSQKWVHMQPANRGR